MPGRGAALRLRGGGTKDFYGNALRGEFSIRAASRASRATSRPSWSDRALRHAVVRAGRHAAEHAVLPFEPPHFGADATFGGVRRSGLSGPRRASAARCAITLLGAKLITAAGACSASAAR